MIPTPAPARKFSLRKVSIRKADVLWFVLVLCVTLLVRTYVFQIVYVDGDSMLDTLHDGDRLAVTLLDTRIFGPGRDEVVICTYPQSPLHDEERLCVKRVIGLPGDVLRIAAGTVLINGEALQEPYINRHKTEDFPEITVPDGHYFVMGDNRSNSSDSRSPHVGLIPREKIHGRAHLIVWPPAHIGGIP